MYACIDLGSNSFHLLIGKWEAGRIQIIERCSEKVQLGEDVRSTHNISPHAFQRGLACLQRFRSRLAQYTVKQYGALGTNAFRVTDNAEEFVEAASTLGIDISIISGVQEAVLIYAGVITALPTANFKRLIIDIGGGSTEIIIGAGNDRLLTESLAIGSVAWRDRFFADDKASIAVFEQQMDSAVSAAKKVFACMAPGVRKSGWSEAYASSGTVKMLAAICEAHGYGQVIISLAALYELKPAFISSIATGAELPGVKENRRDLLLAGWCVMVGLMESYEIETINFSATALREGMLDFMVKNKKTLRAMEQSDLPAVRGTRLDLG